MEDITLPVSRSKAITEAILLSRSFPVKGINLVNNDICMCLFDTGKVLIPVTGKVLIHVTDKILIHITSKLLVLVTGKVLKTIK